MTLRPRIAWLLASLIWLSCAGGRTRPAPPLQPALTDPFTAPVSSAVVRKAHACQKPEDCGAPASDGIAWECRLGACTPTSPAEKEPPPDQPPAAALTPTPLPDTDTPAQAPDRSTLPPGLFAPSPTPVPISPVEPPPPGPAPPAAPPPPPPPPAAPLPAPPAAPAPPNTPPPTTPPPAAPPG